MTAQMSAVILDRGALALHHVLQMIDVGAAGLLQCAPGGCGHDDIALDALAQLLLGLRAREAVRGAPGAPGGNLALDARGAGPPRAVPAPRPSRVGSLEETTAAVGAPTHRRRPMCRCPMSCVASAVDLLGEPLFEHRAGEADVPADAQARYPVGAHGFVDPARLHGQQHRRLVRTEQGPLDEYRLGYGGACGFCPLHPR